MRCKCFGQNNPFVRKHRHRAEPRIAICYPKDTPAVTTKFQQQKAHEAVVVLRRFPFGSIFVPCGDVIIVADVPDYHFCTFARLFTLACGDIIIKQCGSHSAMSKKTLRALCVRFRNQCAFIFCTPLHDRFDCPRHYSHAAILGFCRDGVYRKCFFAGIICGYKAKRRARFFIVLRDNTVRIGKCLFDKALGCLFRPAEFGVP